MIHMNVSRVSSPTFADFSQKPLSETDAFFESLQRFDQESNDLNKQKLIECLKVLFDNSISFSQKNNAIKHISSETAHTLLYEFTLLECQKKGTSPRWILESIDHEMLLKILKSKYEGMRDLSEWLKACKEKLLQPEEVLSAPTGELRKIWNAIKRFITNLIDIFLIAFTLFDVGKDPQSAWEAQAMLDIYYKFFMIPAVIAILIKIMMPLADWQVYAVAGGVVAALMVLLTLYIRFLRPCPDTLPHCESNLTKDASEGKISPVFGRDQEVEELIQRLCSGRDVFLVGESGVGKNEIVKELARRIAKGDVPKVLKDRKVFLVNTASLVQGGFFGYADQMKILLNRIRDLRHVILFFDEAHVALKNNSTLSDFFKLILDKPDLMCIAATTEREFKEHIEGRAVGNDEPKKGDPAFLRRFHVIQVQSMKGKILEEVLNRHQQNVSPFISVKNDVILHLVSKIEEDNHFSKKAEPGFALSVLDLCISHVDNFFDPAWESQRLKLFKTGIQSLKSLATEDIDSIRPSRGQNNEERLGARETIAARKLFEQYKGMAETKRTFFRALYKNIGDAVQSKGQLKEELERELFLKLEYQIPALNDSLHELEQKIQNLSRSMGEELMASVSNQVVDKVLERLKSRVE